jgi:23S rRNA G2069 N7-methylase RlmK/C1962 C5-methylase RlmI
MAFQEEKTAAQARMLVSRLVKRQRHLRKWARRVDAGVYRLYDRDIPEIPLVLDFYGAADTASGAALAGALYKRPFEREGEEAWLKMMKMTAAEALGLDPSSVFLRLRSRQRGAAQYERLSGAGVVREVREGGLRYKVNLTDYLDTGIFPDRRLLRALVRREAAGRRVLNLFCYTGTISAAAAAGGAVLVDSVDLSNTYLEWARANFALNGLIRAEYRFIPEDALRFVAGAQKRPERWDIIILDPPAFSNSKKMYDDFDLKRDCPSLVSRCLRLLAPGGVLYLSAGVKGFRLDLPGAEEITEKLRDEDFRKKRIPATWRIPRGALRNDGAVPALTGNAAPRHDKV